MSTPSPAAPRPRWLPSLALMPRWLASLSAQGGIAGYRLRLRWNGRHVLEPAAVPAGEPCIVVVDSALPFRRRLQRFPETAKARLAMLRSRRGMSAPTPSRPNKDQVRCV